MPANQDNKLPDLQINGLSLEKALDLIEDMTEVLQHKRDGLIIYSGHSDKFGLVHIILGSGDNAVILPWLTNIYPADNQNPLNTHSTAA